MNSDVSSAPAASTSGARERGVRCTGDSRAASRLVQLEIGVERELHHRREVVHARQRHAAQRSDRARDPCAAQSVANSIAARCPPAECPPTTMRSGFAPCAAPSRASHATARRHCVDDRRDRHVGAQVVIDDRDRVASRHERPGDEREVALVERPPVAAVQEHERSARVARRQEQVERLLRARSVAQVELRRERRARLRRRLRVIARASAGDRGPRRGCCSRARRTPACSRSCSRGLAPVAAIRRPPARSRSPACRARRCRRRGGRPATTAPTPAGVPVKMRSPGRSS